MLDMPVRVEHQQLGALPRREPRQTLRRERVQPREPVFSGDGENGAITERSDGGTRCEGALLAERVAEVTESGLVGDGARDTCEDSGHQSTRASRADACEASSRPRAAMSHAHSRCASTRPYMRVAAA